MKTKQEIENELKKMFEEYEQSSKWLKEKRIIHLAEMNMLMWVLKNEEDTNLERHNRKRDATIT